MKENMKNKIACTLSVAMVSMIGLQYQSVHAYEETKTTVQSTSNLTQIGTPSNTLVPLRGFAKDLPLLTVLEQITPHGWVVKKSPGNLDVHMLVSWEGGNTWVDTLDTLVKTYPFSATVNWNKKEVLLSSSLNTEKTMIFEIDDTAKKNISDTSSNSTPIASTTTSTTPIKTIEVTKTEVAETVEVSKNTPISSSAKNWVLDSNKSLKENVELWAKESGYKLVWLGEDYSFDDNRIMTGLFDSENGPIKQLAIDYGPESRAQQPLSFQFFKNNTLVVENWKFEQSGYPQVSGK